MGPALHLHERLVAVDLAERIVEVFAADEVEELGGGHQSRVFRVVSRNGAVAVAKVLDATTVDRHELDARLDVTAALADLDPRVCRPLLIGRERVTEVTVVDGQVRYVVCFEFAEGLAPDPAKATDAERMGTTLWELHASMSVLPAASLPLVSTARRCAANDASRRRTGRRSAAASARRLQPQQPP